jgi:hypothetical protein
MKRLFFFIVLLSLSFNNLSKADSIQDFEIKGISLGDSLLDHFVKEDVLYYDAFGRTWDNPKFRDFSLYLKNSGKKTLTRSPKFDKIESFYHMLQVTYKIDQEGNADSNDFKVKGISGIINYETANNSCSNDAKEVIEVFNSLLLNINYTFDEFPEGPFYQLDPTGKSTNKRFTYSLQTGEAIMIGCTYIRNNELIKKGRKSFLRVTLHSKEVRDFLTPIKIDDFVIEEISVNKSLLDFFSLEKIKKKQINASTQGYIYSIIDKKNSNLENYDALHVHYKKNDNDYKIKGIEGILDFVNNDDQCLLKKKEISNEVFDFFKSKEIKKHSNIRKNKKDKSGNSYNDYTAVMFPDGGLIVVECNIWSKKMKFINNLRVRIYTGDYK